MRLTLLLPLLTLTLTTATPLSFSSSLSISATATASHLPLTTHSGLSFHHHSQPRPHHGGPHPRSDAADAPLLTALSKIDNATLSLGAALTPFTGSPFQLLPILLDSAALLADILSATKIASSSPNLTVGEAIDVASATIKLAGDVNATLTTLIAKKRVFEREFLSGAILLDLIAEKAATDGFGKVVLTKVPPALVATAMNLMVPIDASFNLAIKAYESL